MLFRSHLTHLWYVSVNLRNPPQAQPLQKHLLTPKRNITRIKTPKTQKLFKRETCGEINVFFVVFISLFQPVLAWWFHLIMMVLALHKWLQIFSPLMSCGSPFGGFVSPFVGFVGFCIWVCFIFFLQKSRWPVVMGSQ